MTDLIDTNRATFLDVTYKSIQLFVGEFEYVSVYNQPVPLLLNIARFMALFVTFGTIFTIILKQKIYHLNIRLFYRDVLIISDRNSDYALSLAGNFHAEGRKTILAILQRDDEAAEIFDSAIPTININIETEIDSGLRTCNAKNAKNIYLFCQETKTNVLLATKINSLKKNIVKKAPGGNENEPAFEKTTVDGLLKKYYTTEKPDRPYAKKTKRKKNGSVVCYVHYKNDSDRRYYSADEVFTNRQDGFETYFINVYDISARQLIAAIDFKNIAPDAGAKPKDYVKSLEGLKIAVAGSGEILGRALTEISKTFVVNRKYPMEIFLLNSKKRADEKESIKNTRLLDIMKINSLPVSEYAEKPFKIDVLFIVSDDEKEIFEVLQSVFHFGLQEYILRYAMLTQGNNVEYKTLEKNITHLISPYTEDKRKLENGKEVKIFIGNVKNLVAGAVDFYERFAPTIREVHSAYQAAVSNNVLSDFERLPERYIVSNILSSIHVSFLDDVLSGLKARTADENEFAEKAKPVLHYYADTEHERWYNERYLQGYRHAQTQEPLYLKSKNLVHWDMLDSKQREENVIYALHSLLAYKRKKEHTDKEASAIKEYIIK